VLGPQRIEDFLLIGGEEGSDLIVAGFHDRHHLVPFIVIRKGVILAHSRRVLLQLGKDRRNLGELGVGQVEFCLIFLRGHAAAVMDRRRRRSLVVATARGGGRGILPAGQGTHGHQGKGQGRKECSD